MNYQDAIRRINKLLGLEKFNSYKVAEKDNELIIDGELAVGEPIYIISDNGQLPAQDGEYELEDTTKIKVKDGKVHEIKYDMEKKTENFVDATLADGTVVRSKTFDVGEDVSVVAPDGKETPAPDGEHELKLKDESGNEVTIKIITKDGKIVERENVELASTEVKEDMEMTPDLSEVESEIDELEFKKTVMGMLGEIKDAIAGVVKDQEEMKAKVAKFSKEPAGQPIKQPKNLASEYSAAQDDAITALMRTRQNVFSKTK